MPAVMLEWPWEAPRKPYSGQRKQFQHFAPLAPEHFEDFHCIMKCIGLIGLPW